MIVKMKHLDLVCVAADKEATLSRLRDLGAVHLDLRSASGAAVAAAKGEAADAEKAVRMILKAREGLDRNEGLETRPHPVEEILAMDADREKLKAEAEEFKRSIAVYEPFGDFDPALAKKLIDAGIDLSGVAELPETLPPMRLSEMRIKLGSLETRIAATTARIAGSDEKSILKRFPAIADRIAFECAKELMAESGAVAYVSGWIPGPKVAALSDVARESAWGLLVRDPVEGETPPTLIEPPRLFKPVKVLFDGLGIAPAYNEADVSVPFMCYFSLFFAMLVGDGAYGAIFLAATLLMRKKLPKSWFVLLTVFSAATVAWGFLSNTWFGASIPWFADWPTVKWLADPSYANMMLLCFTIGVSHLMVARLWNGICLAPDSTALAEFGWAGILLFMYCVTNSIVGIFPSIPTAVMWIFGVSLVLVFGFSVKPSQLKARGAELGMLPLNIMSALGDIISYVRLFAVGLASVKVAENFNSMATDLVAGADAVWMKALMSVAMVAILVVGHGLNLAMAALSILVHAVRLNTLEFSNHKGVSWSGYSFSPFKKTN
jgi:V/A-type H+-transporting ATPase subunit I